MSFNSIDFLIFFPIVLLVYFIVPVKVKNIWLLVASYYFYMSWNAKYAVLILFSTFITYLSGIAIENIKQKNINDEKKILYSKYVVATSLIINLGILFFFKYYNFAIDGINAALGIINIQVSVPAVDVLLPVGISFYTFQALSYTIDVYRGDIYAEKNFFQYALFVSFFPQLVAGPIERSKHLFKQLSEPRKLSISAAREGFLLMLWGYFQKIVIADRIAIYVDTVYGNYGYYQGYYLVVAALLFAFQLYCDFAGYSTIAMGAAKFLQIDLMENFKSPYLSETVAEFWRNWHISLTSWFRDYLYIPLGGNRKGKRRKHLNILIVFLTSGLWHGADFSFVAWGGINGIYQIIGDYLKPVRNKVVQILRLNRNSIGHRAMKVLITFLLVAFSDIFFRANSIMDAAGICYSIIRENNPWILLDGSLFACGLDEKNFHLMIISIALLLIVDYCKKKGIKIREIIIRQDWWVRWLTISFAIVLLLLFGKYGPAYDAANFIYFQF